MAAAVLAGVYGLRHDERINCPFWLVLFAPCCVAHHSGSFGYPHSSRLVLHKNYCPIIEHFILSSCLSFAYSFLVLALNALFPGAAWLPIEVLDGRFVILFPFTKIGFLAERLDWVHQLFMRSNVIMSNFHS